MFWFICPNIVLCVLNVQQGNVRYSYLLQKSSLKLYLNASDFYTESDSSFSLLIKYSDGLSIKQYIKVLQKGLENIIMNT